MQILNAPVKVRSRYFSSRISSAHQPAGIASIGPIIRYDDTSGGLQDTKVNFLRTRSIADLLIECNGKNDVSTTMVITNFDEDGNPQRYGGPPLVMSSPCSGP